MKPLRWIGRYLAGRVARHPLVSLLITLLFLFLVSVVVLLAVEPEVETLREALMMVLPPFLGQVLENSELPASIAAVWFIGLVASIGALAVITALIVNRFLMICLQGGRVTKRTSRSGHVVICGWNSQGEGVVEELLNAGSGEGIVILARINRCPVSRDVVEFVHGDPTQDGDLKRAGVDTAESVIVLTDFTSDPNESDARALLIALAVESLNSAVHSCVQILNSANKRHFERAGVDELICLDQIGGNLAVASALNHGVSALVSELLTFNSGSEFYRSAGNLVYRVTGMSFAEASRALMEDKIILLGVETDDSYELRQRHKSDLLHTIRRGTGQDRVVIVNPQGEYTIAANDALFSVAEHMES